MPEQPVCPNCRKRIDRFQRAAPTSPGIYASYPCNCWHTPDQAKVMTAAWRRSGT